MIKFNRPTVSTNENGYYISRAVRKPHGIYGCGDEYWDRKLRRWAGCCVNGWFNKHAEAVRCLRSILKRMNRSAAR